MCMYLNHFFSITFAPTLFIQSSTVNITNCQFIANQGRALYVDNSSVHLLGHNYFGYNTGYQGAAMYLGQGAEIQLILTLVMFEGNHANATGGAIIIHCWWKLYTNMPLCLSYKFNTELFEKCS